MKRIINFFKPKETIFFDMLAGQAGNILEAACLFEKFLSKYDKLSNSQRQEYATKLHELEKKGDGIAHGITEELNKTFITPIDREDIHNLAAHMDNIIDSIDLTARRLLLYKMEKSTAPMLELGGIIVRSVENMHKCTANLSNFDVVKQHCIAIQELENEADRLHDSAIFGVMGKEMDAMNAMKLKDVYGYMEATTDECESVAHVMEGIIVKHA